MPGLSRETGIFLSIVEVLPDYFFMNIGFNGSPPRRLNICS